MKPGELIEITKRVGRRWEQGDIAKVVYVSGDFVDVDDKFGGKRCRKGKNGVQRFHISQIKKYEEFDNGSR